MKKSVLLISLSLILFPALTGGARDIWIGPSPVGVDWGRDGVDSAQVEELVVDRLLDEYELAVSLLTEGALEDAVDAFQGILAGQEDGLIQLPKEKNRYVSVKGSALDQLIRLGKPGRELYRQQFDPEAAILFRAARAHDDLPAMKQVVAQYLLSSHGPAALKWVGEKLLSAGRLAESIEAWELLAKTYPAQIDPMTRAKIASSYAYSGDSTSAKLHLAALERLGDTFKIRGKEEFLTELREQIARPGFGKGATDWSTWGGGPTRAGKAAAIGKVSGLLSAIDFAADGFPGVPEAILKIAAKTGSSPILLAGAGDRIYLSTGYAVLCYRLGSEPRPVWSYSAVKRASFSSRDFMRSQITITLEAGKLYTVMLQTSKGPRRLVCLDAASGRELWTSGEKANNNKEEKAFLKGLSLQGSPVVKGDAVYIMGHRVEPNGQAYSYFVICLNAKDGSLRWKRRISREGRNQNGQVGGLFGPMRSYALAASGGQLYCATNAGTVASVDARSGRLLWVLKYPRPEMIRGQWNGMGFGRRGPRPARPGTDLRTSRGKNDYTFGWRDLPPILMGGRLYVAPRDGRQLLCIEPATGKVLWTFDRSLGPVGASLAHVKAGEARWTAQILGVDPTRQLIFLSGGWMLYTLDCSRDGALAAIPQLIPDGGAFGQGCVAGDRLYLPTQKRLYEVEIPELIGLEPNEAYGWTEGLGWDEAAIRADQPVGALAGNVTITGGLLITCSSERLGIFYNWRNRAAQLAKRIKDSPDEEKASILLQRGQVLLHEGQADKAIADFRTGLAHASRLAKAKELFDWEAHTSLWPGAVLDRGRHGLRPFSFEAAQAREWLSLAYRRRGMKAATGLLPPLGSREADTVFSPESQAAAKAAGLFYKEAAALAVLDQSYLAAVVEQARCAEVLGRWTELADLYQEILARCPETEFDFGQVDQGRQTRSVRMARRFARMKVAALIAEQGRTVYEKYDEEATLRLKKSGRTQKELAVLIARFPNSLAAGDAMLAAADAALAAGDSSRATRLWRSYISRFGAGSRVGDAYARLADAYVADHRVTDARQLLLRLSRLPEAQGVTITAGGNRVKAAVYARERLAEKPFSDLNTARTPAFAEPKKVIWSAPLPRGKRLGPFLARTPGPNSEGPVVFAVAGPENKRWTVLSHDLATGRLNWTRPAEAATGRIDLLKAGSALYLADGKKIARWDLKTGKPIWHRDDLAVAPGLTPEAMVEVDGVLYSTERADRARIELAATPDELCAVVERGSSVLAIGLDPATGSVLWQAETTPLMAEPILSPGYLVLTVRGRKPGTARVVVFDSGSGDPVLQTPEAELKEKKRFSPSALTGLRQHDLRLLISDGRLYLFTSAKLACYRLAGGPAVWEQALPYSPSSSGYHSAAPVNFTAMSQNDTYLALVLQEQRLLLVEKATGKILQGVREFVSRGNAVILDCALWGDRLFWLSTKNVGKTEAYGVRGRGGQRSVYLTAFDLKTQTRVGKQPIDGVRHLYRLQPGGDRLAVLCDKETKEGRRGDSMVWVVDGRTLKATSLLAGKAGSAVAGGSDMQVIGGRLVVVGRHGVCVLGGG